MHKHKLIDVRWLTILAIAVFIGAASAQSDLNIYGYFSTRFEKTFSEPGLENGRIVKEDAPAEFGYPFFNLMAQHQMGDRFKVFVNLNGAGGGTIDLRNFWGEYSANRYLNLRLGKIYRKFGLYNEILDAVPTYYGIEPPELFDFDHLILTRTTTFMLYGSVAAGAGALHYSLTTDNGEGDPVKDTVPIGGDLNYRFGGGNLILGVSGYASGGPTLPDIGLGDGSPKSGVLPWMSGDDFNVFDAYIEGRLGNLTVQTEYTRSTHDAERDPATVVAMINNAGPNTAQRARFLVNPSGAVDEGNVSTNGDYKVKAWYFRGGYAFETRIGEVAPYVQWDGYENPETIAKKTFGGDNEAGVADDGKFTKATIGVVYRPAPEVAVKLDGSKHYYKFNGEDVSYPEIRLDVSFIFGQ